MKEMREKRIKKFVENQLKFIPDANKNVLLFIANILYHGVPDISLDDSCETIRSTFRAGYCYYFAQMLKIAFERGEVCWAAPYGHIVWQDTDGICYDVEGVTECETDLFIPISYIGKGIEDFMHVDGKGHGAQLDEITDIITKYCAEKNIEEKGRTAIAHLKR